MNRYEGGCHCGRVRFAIESEMKSATQCNCSVCTKKGSINHRVAPERLHLLQGNDALGLYQFGTRTAKHWHCKHCGIHVYSNPRRAPDQFAINLRCLDDYHRIISTLEIGQFDGQHWEAANAAAVASAVTSSGAVSAATNGTSRSESPN